MAFIDAAGLARDLARHAEAVCRHYLPAGHKQGRYWIVGDVQNAPGRSLFVRLVGGHDRKGAAGRWQDAATGHYGDLLDLIRHRHAFVSIVETAHEAGRFLGSSRLAAHDGRLWDRDHRSAESSGGAVRAARRLFAAGTSIQATLAATYLQERGIDIPSDVARLRFHPRCYLRPDPDGPRETWPALIAAVTDLGGLTTGVQRTFLARDGCGKAPLAQPRRALGVLRGHAVRFGPVHDILLAGEGIETVLSIVTVLPTLPAVAALSAQNLAALLLPPMLRRLYIARDNDAAGRKAVAALVDRARAIGIETIVLVPGSNDFNDDLRAIGPGALRGLLRVQLAPEDVKRVMGPG